MAGIQPFPKKAGLSLVCPDPPDPGGYRRSGSYSLAPMVRRYFSSSPIQDDDVVLKGSQAHHLLHVMRAQVGDQVVIFDGSGIECDCRVERCGRSDVALRVLVRCQRDQQLGAQITLGVALPKGDRQRWLVEKAVEVGVARLQPVTTQRSVARPSSAVIQRLERTVTEASKQCGRNRLMEVAAPLTWEEFVAGRPLDEHALIAHPGGTPLDPVRMGGLSAVTVAIGPEGGFLESEVELARIAGWQQVDLGPHILRVETAALVATSAIALASGAARVRDE